MADLTELQKTVDRLAALDERRAQLVEYRDRQIVAALSPDAEGGKATWVQVQEVTKLTPRGLQLAIKRANRDPGTSDVSHD